MGPFEHLQNSQNIFFILFLQSLQLDGWFFDFTELDCSKGKVAVTGPMSNNNYGLVLKLWLQRCCDHQVAAILAPVK